MLEYQIKNANTLLYRKNERNSFGLKNYKKYVNKNRKNQIIRERPINQEDDDEYGDSLGGFDVSLESDYLD